MQIEVRARVTLPPDAAWQRLADLSALSQWAPDVAGSPAEALRPGATRWARLYAPTYGKDVLIERITDVDPRRRTFSYDIEGGIGPLRTIRTTWSVAPAEGGSVVAVRSDVTLAGAARFVPFLVRRAWTKQLQALADGFARWAGRLQGDVEVMDGPDGPEGPDGPSAALPGDPTAAGAASTGPGKATTPRKARARPAAAKARSAR